MHYYICNHINGHHERRWICRTCYFIYVNLSSEHFCSDCQLSLTLVFVKLFIAHLSIDNVHNEYECSILERNTWGISKFVKRGHIQNSIYET